MIERGIGSLDPLIGLRRGTYSRAIGSDGDERVQTGKLVTRGSKLFGKTGMRIEQLIDIGDQSVESLWIISYIPYPDQESEDQVGGTLVASIFDSLGKHWVLEGKWEDEGEVLRWKKPGEDPGRADDPDQDEAPTEITWEFTDDGRLGAKAMVAGRIVAAYKTAIQPGKERFPHLPSGEGVGVLAKLAPLLGRWENSWKVVRKFNGEEEKLDGKATVVGRRILGGHFIEEVQTPHEPTPGNQGDLTIIGAAEEGSAGDENLRLWFRGQSPPIPAAWKGLPLGITVDHVSRPHGDFKIVSKGGGRFLSDDHRTFESYLHVTSDDAGLDDEVRISGDVKRLPE